MLIIITVHNILCTLDNNNSVELFSTVSLEVTLKFYIRWHGREML